MRNPLSGHRERPPHALEEPLERLVAAGDGEDVVDVAVDEEDGVRARVPAARKF